MSAHYKPEMITELCDMLVERMSPELTEKDRIVAEAAVSLLQAFCLDVNRAATALEKIANSETASLAYVMDRDARWQSK